MMNKDENLLASPERGKQVKYIWPEWLTRQYVSRRIVAIIVSIVLGPVVGVLIATAGDQWVRNKIDALMSEPELHEFLKIEPEEYHSAPVRWRQIISEIANRRQNDSVELKETIQRLSQADMELVGRMARYVVNTADSSLIFTKLVAEISDNELRRLEGMGVISTLGGGVLHNFGDKTLLYGVGALIVTLLEDPEDKPQLFYVPLTATGGEIVQMLQRQLSLDYLERVARAVEEDSNGNASVEIWAIGVDQIPEKINLQDGIAGWIDRNSIIMEKE